MCGRFWRHYQLPQYFIVYEPRNQAPYRSESNKLLLLMAVPALAAIEGVVDIGVVQVAGVVALDSMRRKKFRIIRSKVPGCAVEIP